MSQYPMMPQQPPQGPWPNYASPFASGFDPQSRAKRAGTLMIVLGVLGLMFGGCQLVFAFKFDQIQAMYTPEMRAQMHFTPDMKHDSMVKGQIFAVISLMLCVLGFMIRGGGRLPLMVGASLTMLLTLFWWLGAAASLAIGGASPLGLCATVTAGAIASLFTWLLAWLVQALRSSTPAAAAQMQAYQMQYQQYLQQQQQFQQHQGFQQQPPPNAYGQQSYNAPSTGSPQPMIPPPPPPPNPPQGAPNEQGPRD